MAGYSIWIEAEEWAPGQWDPLDDNSDVRVTFDSGDVWYATFVSYRNVLTLSRNWAATGENLGGRYLAITDMILVDEVSRPRIEAVVADLLEERAFEVTFRRDADPGRAPVYLGTLDQLDTASADETARLSWLASTLATLGFQLMSGKAPNYHELWAARVPAPAPAVVEQAVDAAADFERRFLAWLHITFGVLPEGRQGTNAEWWEVEIAGSHVAIGLVHASSRSPTPEWDWLLRVEEAEPLTFLPAVEAHFEAGSGLRRRMSGGRIRVQFKSTALVRPFTDQADET
jgi:hypothetical protein